MTYLCVAIFAHTPEQVQRDTAAAAEAGADLVELRLDHLTDADAARWVVSQSALPCILTCRPTWEGGHSALGSRARVELLDAAAGTGTGGRYVDVELKTYGELKLGGRADIARSIIVSAHDFDGRPDRLYNIIAEMNAAPANVNKVVWTARTVRDNLEAFELLQTRQKPTIALCMGEAGLISRVLAKKFGAFLTFASLGADSGTAPGQVSIRDMKRLYRWDAINPRTKIYGVVASPVAHSMSPAIHNAAFDQTGHDGVYLPLLVNPGYESFKAFMESFLHFGGLDLSGLSVTLPHKENALRYVSEKGGTVDPLAARIGAVNTIEIGRDPTSKTPKLGAFNSDYAAIIQCIQERIGRVPWEDLRVAVIGAGGTGRTAVAALAHCGATVVVYNRTRDRADSLAAEFNGRTGKVVAAPIDKLCDSCCHIYLNTTSIGMSPKVDESPFGERPPKLTPDTIVFDAVYNPPKTKFLKQAEAAGAKTIGGIEMFVRQAATQFEAWTGKIAPTDVMRRVVEQRLGVSA